MKNITRLKKSAKKRQEEINEVFAPIWDLYKENFEGNRKRSYEYFCELENILINFKKDIIEILQIEEDSDEEFNQVIQEESEFLIKAIQTVRKSKTTGIINYDMELLIVSFMKLIGDDEKNYKKIIKKERKKL